LNGDESLAKWDAQLLRDLPLKHQGFRVPAFELLRAHEEPLLAVPDVVAGCWARGDDWKRRIRPLVTDVRKLP
jgi:hypothetical protein